MLHATVLRGFLISWMNVFFMSRPVETCSYFRTIHMVLLQIGRFILNIITIVVLIVYVHQFSGFEEGLKTILGYTFIGLIFAGITNIVLVFLYTYQPGSSRENKHEPKTLDKSTSTDFITLNKLDNGDITDDEEEDSDDSDDQQDIANSLKMFITETQRNVARDSHTVELKMMPLLELKQN